MMLLSQAHNLALIFALIFWATLAMREKQDIPHWAGYGALWAFGVLINPSILSLFPFCVGWLVWEARKARAAWAKPVTAALLIFAICLVPWTIRNYRVRVRQCEELAEYAMAEQIREILIDEQDHQIALATALGKNVPLPKNVK